MSIIAIIGVIVFPAAMLYMLITEPKKEQPQIFEKGVVIAILTVSYAWIFSGLS